MRLYIFLLILVTQLLNAQVNGGGSDGRHIDVDVSKDGTTVTAHGYRNDNVPADKDHPEKGKETVEQKEARISAAKRQIIIDYSKLYIQKYLDISSIPDEAKTTLMKSASVELAVSQSSLGKTLTKTISKGLLIFSGYEVIQDMYNGDSRSLICFSLGLTQFPYSLTGLVCDIALTTWKTYEESNKK